MQARVLEQVAADDLAGDQLVADVLVGDDQDDRQDDKDRFQIKLGQLEIRYGNEVRAEGCHDIRGCDHAGNDRADIAADDCDQDRDDGQELAEQHAAQHRHAERHAEGDDRRGGHIVAHDLTGGRGRARQLQTDQRHDRAHRRRRQHDVDPFGAAFVDDRRQHTAERADHHKAAERVFIAPVLDDQRGRRDEGEGRAQVRRRLALGDQDEQQRADAVHEQHDRRADAQHERHEHGGAEHGEHVLDGQRHQQARRHLVLYLNDFFVLHRLFYTPLHLVAPRRRL